MNAEWHRRHVMPKGSSTKQRIAWHREHQEQCACRPIPPALKREMARASTDKKDGGSAIDAYLAKVDPTHRALLQRLRKAIHTIVPAAEECISYGLPAFRVDGVVVGGFAATAAGGSYYPFSGTTLATLASELEDYSQTKGALHFRSDRPLPASLVRKLLKARIAEIKGSSKRR